MEAIARRVGNASVLQSQNLCNEAFLEYLGCMCVVAQQLSQSKGILLFASTQASFDSVTASVTQLFSYGRQCLDQSEAILKKEIEEERIRKLGPSISSFSSSSSSSSSSSFPSIPSTSLSSSPSPSSSLSSSSSGLGSSPGTRSSQDLTSPSSNNNNNNINNTSNNSSNNSSNNNNKSDIESEFVKIGGVATPQVPHEADGRKRIQAAMHEAQQKNLLLLQSYKYQARVDKLKSSYGENNPAIQAQLSDMSLKFSREYAENYQIAKIQQEAILREIENSKAAFQNLQRISVVNEFQNKHNPFKAISLFANNQTSRGLKISRDMDAEWRKLLKVDGVNEKTVLNYLGHILSLVTHPLGKEAARLVDETEAQLRLTSPSHDYETFKEKIQTVRTMLQTTQDTILATYPEVDVNEGPEAVNLCVDLVLFPRIYPTLFDWFLQKNQENDEKVDKKFQIFAGVQPAHIGVRKLFWLEDTGTSGPPYQKAIDFLRRLSSITTTSSKMQCLIDTSKTAVECASKYWEGRQKITIGADDLVPIMSYIIIKAAVKNIHAEISLVEEFIPERMMIGEAGYCLSTFQTCLFYIEDLDWKEADQQHTDMQK